jgi:hypothetical protein
MPRQHAQSGPMRGIVGQVMVPQGHVFYGAGPAAFLMAVCQHLTYVTGPAPFSPYSAGALSGAYTCLNIVGPKHIL